MSVMNMNWIEKMLLYVRSPSNGISIGAYHITDGEQHVAKAKATVFVLSLAMGLCHR